jgi:hypothetical protein
MVTLMDVSDGWIVDVLEISSGRDSRLLCLEELAEDD